MPGVERAGDKATCTHPNTGSSTVFANGAGITRVEQDYAGGLILGAGSQNTYVEGQRISLPGDVILPHACCGSPTCSPHCSAKTGDTEADQSPDVWAGTGYPLTSVTGPGGDLAYEDHDLNLVSFGLSSTIAPQEFSVSANAGGNGLDPGVTGYIPHYYLSGPVIVNYTLQNNSVGPVDKNFTVGLWSLDEFLGVVPGEEYILIVGGEDSGDGLITAQTDLEPPPILLLEEEVEGMSPLASSDLFLTLENYDNTHWLQGETYYYSLYVDIYTDIEEPNEENASLVATLTIL